MNSAEKVATCYVRNVFIARRQYRQRISVARCSQFRVNLDNLHQVFLLTLVDLNENIKLFIVIARDSRRAQHFYSNATRSVNETRLLGTSCQPNENSKIRLRSFSVSSFLPLEKLGEKEGEMLNGKVAQNNSRNDLEMKEREIKIKKFREAVNATLRAERRSQFQLVCRLLRAASSAVFTLCLQCDNNCRLFLCFYRGEFTRCLRRDWCVQTLKGIFLCYQRTLKCFNHSSESNCSETAS